MIADPTLASRELVQKENSIVNATPGSTVQVQCRLGSITRQNSARVRRRSEDELENTKRRHSAPGCLGQKRMRRDNLKDGGIEAVTLFEVVSMGVNAMQDVIDEWIEAYKKDRDAALLDLISFFMQCSGCKGIVTAEMFQRKHNTEDLNKMIEEFDENTGLQYKKFMAFPWILTVTWPLDMASSDYPLSMPGPYWKKFKCNFCEFIVVLVRQCQYSIIYDSYLMDTVISLLTELSDSHVRAFRHTCTMAALKLLTALVSVTQNLSVSADNTERLFKVEKNKVSSERTRLRLEQLEEKTKELQNKQHEVENMMNAIFRGVFLKRYRDIIPEIRACCMEEIGIWMKLHSNMFLNDSYLKYVGWMLHDKQPEVRLKCIQGLHGIYSDKRLISKLDLFTSRFKERIISMASDKDPEVAVHTMKLLVLISQNCDDVLTTEDCKNLCLFVYSSHRPLAAAAGEFLYGKLLSYSPQQEQDELKTAKEQNMTVITTLLQFFHTSELHKHMAYLVDSLWDNAGSLLKDWESMTELLLEEPGTQDLNDSQKQSLIEMLLTSVRQATEGHPPVGRGMNKKNFAVKERKIQMDDCIRLTEHLIVALPALLEKYSVKAENVANLLQIPQYFDTDVYRNSHLEKYMDMLLKQMTDVVEQHTHPAVLEACAKTYSVLCSEEVAVHVLANISKDQLIDQWTKRLHLLLEDFFCEGEGQSASKEVNHQLLSTLKRITAFHNAHDLCHWDLYKSIFRLLSDGSQQVEPSYQVIVQALQCAFYAILWQLNRCFEGITSKEKALAQKMQLRSFFRICHQYLNHSHTEVKEQAFLVVCDLLIACNCQFHSGETVDFTPFVLIPDSEMQAALLGFVQVHVFTDEDQQRRTKGSDITEDSSKLNNLHKRRTLLASYCKLVVNGIVEMNGAAEIFKQYMKYYNDFGDIIKETLSRTRQIDKIQSARTLALCLQQLFLEVKNEQGICNYSGSSSMHTLTTIRELARRFSLTFGWDQIKSRESIAMMHKDGIEFVFKGFIQNGGMPPPPNIAFLTILSEFSNRLLKPDKKTVYDYLQRYTSEQSVTLKDNGWHPLVCYRTSLLACGEADDLCSVLSCDTPGESLPINPSRASSLKRNLSDAGDSYQKTNHHSREPSGRNSETKPKLTQNYTEPAMKQRKCLKSSPDVRRETDSGHQQITMKTKKQWDDLNEEIDVDTVEIDTE
uniref:Cohesin subunit SA n=1 Tax=Erpetoichthys calabaricus TaxID=27687 RepID=A0A8C4SNF4_ERPCA